MQIPDKNIKDIVLKLEEMFRKIMEQYIKDQNLIYFKEKINKNSRHKKDIDKEKLKEEKKKFPLINFKENNIPNQH